MIGLCSPQRLAYASSDFYSESKKSEIYNRFSILKRNSHIGKQTGIADDRPMSSPNLI